MKEINKRLIEFRKQNKLTQEELARQLNINLSTYKTYETRNTPKLEMIIKLAEFYDVSTDMLIGRPRPYDLPSTTTQEQRQAVNMILQLNAINTIKAISYCAGLIASQN